MSITLEIGTKNYLDDLLCIKKHLSHMESLLNCYASYTLSEPSSKFGISLISEVLEFAVSISLSIYLLKAIAAERAKIIQSTTYRQVIHSKLYCGLEIAKKKPIKANCIAKIV